MILIHESMPDEATHVERVLLDVLGVRCAVHDEKRDEFFPPIADSSWRGSDGLAVLDGMQSAFPGRPVLLLTPRDLFDYSPERSPDDYWMFGITRGWRQHSVVSIARLRGIDSAPVPAVRVPKATYLRRIGTLAVHEVGHVGTADAVHHRQSWAVNVATDARDALGSHCDDPTCVMYPTIDVRAPKEDLGYMELEAPVERRFDAGLDDQIQRLRASWFCDRCRTAIRLPGAYMQRG